MVGEIPIARWGKPTRGCDARGVSFGQTGIWFLRCVGVPQRDPNVARRPAADLRLEVRTQIKILCRSTPTFVGREYSVSFGEIEILFAGRVGVLRHHSDMIWQKGCDARLAFLCDFVCWGDGLHAARIKIRSRSTMKIMSRKRSKSRSRIRIKIRTERSTA